MIGKILVFAVALLILVAACAIFYIGPRNVIGVLTYGRQARDGILQVGDIAPSVTLITLDGAKLRPLEEWVGDQPLVLIFGSFT